MYCSFIIEANFSIFLEGDMIVRCSLRYTFKSISCWLAIYVRDDVEIEKPNAFDPFSVISVRFLNVLGSCSNTHFVRSKDCLWFNLLFFDFGLRFVNAESDE